MKKRLGSFLLAVCMAVSMLTLPAGAESAARFSDISDQDTIMAVEALRLMGVLDGYDAKTFRPTAALNRAQFCKMAVYAMNADSELGQFSTVTVFPDVKPSHWASGFINLAAKGKKIISGYPDGKFYPDRTVTVGQAVTILLRLLGYKDENIGGVWPDSYMAVGKTIGLTDGIAGNGTTPLTRGEAAKLFLNLLRADTEKGGSYLSSIGVTELENQVLVTSSAMGPDGRETSLQLASGTQTYQIASGKVSNGALNGYRGTLALDKNGKALTFVPDSLGASITITVATAKANQIVDITGASYSVTGDTKAYRNGEEDAWSKIFSWVSAGTSVTLYLNTGGGVDYIFVGGGSASSSAVVIYQNESTAGFADLVHGSTNYKIYKNGAPANGKDMRRYDVATYSPATNSVRVCDTRITGFYESCTPNPSEPETIKVLGHDFPVLPTARDGIAKFKPGDQITLLLTEDNQVAAVFEAKGDVVSNNVVGIVRSISQGSATVELLCGISVSGTLNTQGSVEGLEGQLVRVGSTKQGALAISRLSSSGQGNLDVTARKLGSKSLASNVMIFQVTSNGAEAVSLSQLTSATIPSAQISYARTNWKDQVDLVVIGSTVGSVFYYGRAVSTFPDEPVTDEDGNTSSQWGKNRTVALDMGSKSMGPYETGYTVSSGEYIGISLTGTGSNVHIAALVRLMEVKNVPNTSWTGKNTVVTGGRSYLIAPDIICYNRDTQSWMTLEEAHAYAPSCNLYIHNGAVRIIEVGHS